MSGDAAEQTRERLLAYLLGELPAEELAAFDVRWMREEDFAASLEAARVDLLEEYVRGSCTDQRRERIAQALNLRGAQDHAVRFARALAPALERLTPPQGAPRRFFAPPRASLRWTLTVAACALLGLGLWRYSPWRHREGRALSPAGTSAFTLLLRPVHLRSASGVRVMRIPAAVLHVRVQIVLRHEAQGAEVILRHDSSALRLQGLAIHHLGVTPFVQFVLPRRRLPPGLYHLTLRVLEPGRPETDRYRFLISPP